MTQLNAARKRKHMPPLNRVQLGVQILFTTGQMPVKCNSNPAAMPMTPATAKRLSGMMGANVRYQRPATKPRIIVPSVGMKLSVRYPPSFATNGLTRGKRFKNHWSKALPKFAFLFQCAAKPEKLCAQFAG